MALDTERQNSVHSPKHILSGSGQPTPQPARNSEPQQPAAPAASGQTLKFSIEKILSPEFGRVTRERRDTATHGRDSPQDDFPPKDNSGSHEAENTSPPPQEDPKNRSSILWPAWVYCTRYSDRPSSGPRSRRMKKKEKKPDEKRPRTAFTAEQLARLKQEFQENRYLTEKRRQDLARELKLNESQIKIWFQNKRAKIKKASGQRNPLALQLMAQGLYNHSTVALRREMEEERELADSSP